ncbi:MAG: M48 family metallopeptidase [Kordiimonadaceae bacterium]|nr:M48 family metallopeptidase [Kordiimonadaceae bacterium]MBT6035008.1 M48 family metallopeptidase [Kordiimonadaceae bacterium]MBT6328249.1 M48 family metallopeptidase [Kordiimonadaceae bacterium]MBT7583116.1 M48 family metallopeptidase [Kordiimonadaceae bacterium]
MNDTSGFKIEFKRHNRAKRMKLRYDASTGNAVVTMPPRSSERAAKKFAESNILWLEKQRRSSPHRKCLLPGETIPFEGIDHLIIHDPAKRAGVEIISEKIIVGGTIEGFSVRLENFFKKKARASIEPLAKNMALAINQSFRRIQIRDTKSRWGSCSSSGTLSFSWRLIMTPPDILEYVVAHEISHLKEMNHSKSFWDVVDKLVYDAKYSRKWLKGEEGQSLMLIISE